MKVRVEAVCLNAAGDEQRWQVLTIERREVHRIFLRMAVDIPCARHLANVYLRKRRGVDLFVKPLKQRNWPDWDAVGEAPEDEEIPVNFIA